MVEETGKNWPRPALMLVKTKDGVELWFTEIIPNQGYNSSFERPSLKIKSNFNKENALHTSFCGVLKGVNGLFIFQGGEFEKEMAGFQIELLSKALELAYSDKQISDRYLSEISKTELLNY